MKATYLPTEGSRGFKALCGLAAKLGYKDPFKQLYNDDGSCVGDLLVFFEDNPGAIGAIYEWVDDNYEEELNEEDNEEEDVDD